MTELTVVYWNGLPTRGRKVVGTVPEWNPDTDPPQAWWRDLVGQEIEAVEVVLDGVNYGGGTDYLDDRDGSGWYKVTEGRGSPRWGHRGLPLVDVRPRPGYTSARPARVESPPGVQVIGWTEPTDDEPRSLPIIREAPDDDFTQAPDGWEFAIPDDVAYVIRPIPKPPAPETEVVPWHEAAGRWLAEPVNDEGLVVRVEREADAWPQLILADGQAYEPDDDHTVIVLIDREGTDGD